MNGRMVIILASLMFGTTGTAQELAEIGAPVSVGAARIVVGGALLVGLAGATNAFAGLFRRPALLVVAGVGVAVYQLTFFAAVDQTGVVVSTVVALGIAPVAAGSIEWASTRRAPGCRWAAATALAAAGVLTLSLAASESATVSTGGVALAVAAGLGYAVFAVIAKRLIDGGCESSGVMAGTFGLGALVLLPVLLARDSAWLATMPGLTVALYLGAVPTAIAYLLYARGLRSTSAADATTLTLVEPATAALLGAVVLGERLAPVAVAGVGLVAVALCVLLAPGRRGGAEGLPT